VAVEATAVAAVARSAEAAAVAEPVDRASPCLQWAFEAPAFHPLKSQVLRVQRKEIIHQNRPDSGTP
jgi:hypothetical protein